ncbi:MAG: MFS transporter [Candidatus Bathyarchaeota archaeon]|nr:MFS transporter [Candidatus Bathyarchaeota archaeon A05DMB-3]MDH7606271.1 MFS transporter [Candidatus Bathyarchaeota archaeon]
MWRLGFLFHEMAFGLLSIFLPLYIITLNGSLLDLGIITSTALFLTIPASFFWGYMCDKTRRYKRYILISFLSSSIILCLTAFSTSISLLIILYAIMAVFHVAHEPPKNVLIAELYSRDKWEKSFALYEGLTELGWLIGLLIGTFVSFAGFDAKATLLTCCTLNFLAFIHSAIFLTDPLLVFERGLVNIEKSVEFTYKGVTLASKALDGFPIYEDLKTENLYAFCCGLVFFSFATSTLFTPLPIFFSKNLSLSASMVFAVYILNSSAGVVGYFTATNKQYTQEKRTSLLKIVLFRSILTFLLASFTIIGIYTSMLAALILALMGFAYALYHVRVLSLSMELIPAGKAGLFDVLVSLGSAGGAFLGPFLAQTYDFVCVFLLAGAIFFLAYVTFRIFS